MELPNGSNPDRVFAGQRFVHHKADAAKWGPFRLPGFQARDTTIHDHTGGVAGVHVVRPDAGAPVWASHDSDILFSFVMAGELTLAAQDSSQRLAAGDAFVIPPGQKTRYSEPSKDLELLEVSLPGAFKTHLEG